MPWETLVADFTTTPSRPPESPLNELGLELPGQSLTGGDLPVQGGAGHPIGPRYIFGQFLVLTQLLGSEKDQLFGMGQLHKRSTHQDHPSAVLSQFF